MDRRVSARAIIIENGKIFLMYRRKKGHKFYAFSGGKKEDDETLEQCVVRELKEELGIVVEPQRLVYEFNSPTSKQYFFLCNYVDGIFGTGTGEEFQKNPKINYYEPRQISLKKLPFIEVLPDEIKNQVILDIKSGELYSRKKPLVITTNVVKF